MQESRGGESISLPLKFVKQQYAAVFKLLSIEKIVGLPTFLLAYDSVVLKNVRADYFNITHQSQLLVFNILL